MGHYDNGIDALIYLHAYGLAFLELSFVLVFLLLLHRLRPVLGTACFHLAIGATMIFAQVVTAMGLELIHPQFPGLSVQVGPVIFFIPFMALLLVIYIVDGTLDAQRLIWAVLAMVGSFFFLAYLTENQVISLLYKVDARFEASFVSETFSLSRLFLMASLLSILIEFLVLPVVYEILRHWNLPLGVSVTASLVFTQAVDAFFYQLVTNPMRDFWWDSLRHAFIMRAAAMVWASLIALVYLKMRHAGRAHESSSRRPLDILVAFVGPYSQSRKQQANLQEWEGRFRMVVENAHDLILLVGQSGIILDANRHAMRLSGYRIEELLQLRFQDLMPRGPAWPDVWGRLFRKEKFDHWAVAKTSDSREMVLRARNGDEYDLEAVVSPLFLQDDHGVLIVARDVTERKKLAAELAEQEKILIHSQRMEAVGKLAGGIAHDFNNLLHAIQGSIDHLDHEIGEDPRRKQLLDNIAGATNRAASLTSQMLGFARGGKYEVKQFAVDELIRETEELFRPVVGAKHKLKVAVHPDPMRIEGDFTQLQQVFLNILLNAREALPEAGGTIIFRAEPATEHTPGIRLPPQAADGDAFIVIRVKDNGSGIDEATMARIFEPFFTTKQAQGTGLGLAMAYGCVQNHSGWIHVQSEPGKGTEFFVFLPRL